jgi:hypothetical protein
MKRSLLYLTTALFTFVVGSILYILWAMSVFYITGVQVDARPDYFKCGFTESGNPGYHTQHVPGLMEFAAPLPPAQTQLFSPDKAEPQKRTRK